MTHACEVEIVSPLRVHYLKGDLRRYGMLAPASTSDVNILLASDFRSLSDSWRGVRAQIVGDTPSAFTEIADLTALGTIPVLSRRAHALLRSLLEPYGEFLPLEVEQHEPMLAYNVTNVVDCLDRGRTRGLWLSSDRLGIAEHYEFQPDVAAGAGVFRVPELLLGTVFITSTLLAAVSATNITGLDCPEVWRQG